MYKYFNRLNTDDGKALPGYQVRLMTTEPEVAVDIFADESGTPIESVSGVANAAITDNGGNYQFFVEPGTYNIVFSSPGGTFLDRIRAVPMLNGPQGEKGDTGGPRALTTLADLKAALTGDDTFIYDSAPFKWTTGNFTGQNDDINIVKSDFFALSTGAWVRQGADKVRVTDGGNVQDAIMAATNPTALLATTRAFPVGSVLRTADGFLYTVMSSGETDFHLTTAGGVKLRVVGPDFYLAAFALPGDNTDVTTLFGKALNAANAANGSLIGDGKRHRIASRININRTGKLALRVDLRGSTIFLDDGEVWFGLSDNGNPSPHLSTTLSADVAKGGKLLPMASVAGLAEGDLIQIDSPAHSCNTTGTYHSYVVEKIDSGNVYIRGGFVADITAQQVIDSGMSGPILVQAFKMAPGLVIENGFTEHVDPNGLRIGLNVTQQLGAVIKGLKCDGHTRGHIQLIYGTDDVVSNCTFRHYGYCDEIEPETVNLSAPDGLPFGYGLSHARNYRSTVRDCHGALGWHTFDAARGQMYIDYIACSGERDAYSFATHESAWHVAYYGCRATGRMGFTLARSVHPRMVDCSGGIGGSTVTNFAAFAASCNTVTIKGGAFIAETGGHIYVAPDSAPRPGVVSVGDLFEWRMDGVEFIGVAPIEFGTPTGRIYVSNTKLLQGAYFSNLRSVEINISEVTLDGAHPTQGIVATCDKLRAKNVKNLTPASGGTTCLFGIFGSPSLLDFDACETVSGFLVRMYEDVAAVKITKIANSSAPRFVLGAANVTVANIVNTYRTEPALVAGGAVVTQDVNNVQLSA